MEKKVKVYDDNLQLLGVQTLSESGGGSVESPFAVFEATIWDAQNNIYALSPNDYSKMVEALEGKIVIIKVKAEACGKTGARIYSNVLLNTEKNKYTAYLTTGHAELGPTYIYIEAHETM